MMKKSDLTGQRFGKLTVLHEIQPPYISPGGKPARRWLCRCDCGNERIVLHNALTGKNGTRSCGCSRSETAQSNGLSRRATRICIVCGKTFYAPPSSKKITCSKTCASIRKTQIRTGKTHQWSEEARTRLKENERHIQQAQQQIIKATEIAMQIPEGQKGSQNRACKVWILKAPDGTLHRAVGLLPWARENYRLFEPDSIDPEATARRIAYGFRAIASCMRGNARTRNGHPVNSYKDWQLLSISDKTNDEQELAMKEFSKT